MESQRKSPGIPCSRSDTAQVVRRVDGSKGAIRCHGEIFGFSGVRRGMTGLVVHCKMRGVTDDWLMVRTRNGTRGVEPLTSKPFKRTGHNR